MTGAAVYGDALYELARAEGLSEAIYTQLTVLGESFSQEPDYLQLLSAPNLTKEERCRLLEEAFRGRVDNYLLNFLKILTEKGYIRHFSQCASSYEARYFQDRNILRVTASTAAPLTPEQSQRLTGKLQTLTGKEIRLENQVQPDLMGGVRLDYDGKRLDDTVAHRLSDIRELLNKTVL